MQKQPLSDNAVSNFLTCLLETVYHADANSVDIGLEKNVVHDSCGTYKKTVVNRKETKIFLIKFCIYL